MISDAGRPARINFTIAIPCPVTPETDTISFGFKGMRGFFGRKKWPYLEQKRCAAAEGCSSPVAL
jgi:hypothetical protein